MYVSSVILIPFYLHLVALRFNFYARIINHNMKALEKSVTHFKLDKAEKPEAKVDAFDEFVRKIQEMGKIINETLSPSILFIQLTVFAKLGWRGYGLCMKILGKREDTFWGNFCLNL